MNSVRDLWNDIFDSSLEKFATEDAEFRTIAMVIHILQLEFRRTKACILELKRINEMQAKEIRDYELKFNWSSPLSRGTRTYKRSPLKALLENESTPTKQNINVSNNSEDIFNHQISEIDVNLSRDTDNSLFIDDSLKDMEPNTSPTLNKSKRLSRSAKSREKSASKNLNNSIISGTPVLNIKKVKKFKQSKLSYNLSDITGIKNTTTKENKLPTTDQTNISNVQAIDTDETMYLPAHKSNFLTERVSENNCDVEVILDELHCESPNNKKKIKLDNSYDRLPEVNSSPEFAYKREAVRKKSDRLKLQGWDCEECEKYYANIKGLGEEELQKRMDMCSRHRSKFNPKILTPKGFWDPDFSPTQESIAFDL